MEFKDYNKDELKYIQDNYLTMTSAQIGKHLGKTSDSIVYVAGKLGLKKQHHKGWTESEVEFLKQHYVDMTSAEIAKYLGRTVASVNTQRKKLNLIESERWTKEEIDYLKENYLTMEHSEIAKQLNRGTVAVRAKCHALNLKKKPESWNGEEIEFLKANYMLMPKRDVAEILGRSMNAVQCAASRLGLKKYPYNCDYDYFDHIDTEEKAYWLGFLSADGWISRNERDNSGTVGIELQYGDIDHLRKFNKSINGNYKITDRYRKCTLTNSDKANHDCVLRIYSIVMYESLVRLGFTNNKSFDLSIPKLDEPLIHHYIRGYFDGNGSAYVSSHKLKASFCTASENLKNDIIDICNSNGIELTDYSHVSEYGTTIYRPFASKNEHIVKLLHYMYDDATIYLSRKYKIYLKMLEHYDCNGLAM